MAITVPDNTISIFRYDNHWVSDERLSNIISPIEKTRDWFNSHFYRCLPLTIGNQYGFVIKSEYSVMMKWNGEDYRNSVELSSDEDPTNLYPKFDSHFGHGIVTISVPFMLRTPPGVNLMTINPPNYLLPGITVMTGVVETDNLRNNFTFNLKLNIPGLNIMIPKGTPLAAFIPVPRYYVDNFSLQLAENQFEENDIVEELNAAYDFDLLRSEVEPEMKNHVNRKYLLGTDIYDNKFNDHQGP